jgi:hypothetical protein
MSFGGGGQAVGQGGRPSGTSKVQHFPSTTDSEFRRKASRQTRVKKFYRFAVGMLARLDGFAVRQRRSGLPRHSVWLLMLVTASFHLVQVDSCCADTTSSNASLVSLLYPILVSSTAPSSTSFRRLIFPPSACPLHFASVAFSHVGAPWTTQIYRLESRARV